MAIDLGKWSWVASTAVDFGLPILGTALGIPGPVSAFAITAIKGALNLPKSATPEDVNTAIAADPDTARAALDAAQSDVAAQYAYLTRLAEVRGEVDKTAISEVNETIRAEVSATAAKPDGWWGHWRTWMAYELMLECPFWAALIGWCIVYGKIGELTAAAGILSVWWAARFGVLGVHVWTGSNERQTAISGSPPPGVLSTAVTTIKAATAPKR